MSSNAPTLVTIDVSTDDRDPRLETVGALLRTYNEGFAGQRSHLPLHLFVRDADGLVQGGLIGGSSRGWLYIDIVVMSDALRGQGVGTRLLDNHVLPAGNVSPLETISPKMDIARPSACV